MRLAALTALFVLLLLHGVKAGTVPVAAQLDLNVRLLNLKVNDYSSRRQIRINAQVARENERDLLGVKDSLLRITAPDGRSVELFPQDWQFTPKRFKAAHALVSFRAIEDTASARSSNVPPGFFASEGPFRIELDIIGEQAHGSVSFLDQLKVSLLQDSEAVRDYVLKSGTQLHIFTEPRTIGPVYYKRHDLTNFAFSMASMDQAIESGDFHYIPETPSYLLQVRIGREEGGTTELLDPSRYIDGHQPHMIRSDQTTTPISFHADEFKTGDVVVLDFERTDIMDPNSVFTGNASGLNSRVVHEERLIYALHTDLKSGDGLEMDSIIIE